MKLGQLSSRQRLFLTVGVLLVATALFLFLHHLWTHEETDNAYVTAHVHQISARVAGTVLGVFVQDNEKVQAGQVLAKLDPGDYQAAFDQAEANARRAELDYRRNTELLATKVVTPQDFDTALASRDTTRAQLEAARLNLSYTEIKAPVAGRIGRKTVESGNRIQAGQLLMAVVPDDMWIVANYKETQLPKMKPGQSVTIKIDGLPGHTFTGKVDSFSPATGAQFALLPSDNATGNFTKIVQRVPVKIVFDADSVAGFEDRILAGLSCTTSVDLP